MTGLTEDERKVVTTRVLVEFAAMSLFLASGHADVFQKYQHMIVEARDNDQYPFLPVAVHGPASDVYDWVFDDFHCIENPLDIPDAEDWKDREFVERELAANSGPNTKRQVVDIAENRPAPNRGESPAVDLP